ncbi:acyltransferase [Pokkaliibacter plantistimulans]|uniref:Acyltransferase n=1 Tax=Proteobacteria bacterium 228 TaxID=2083153 RepID=A0A2S5KXC8_9PROT|nr:carbon-nitrogen hydrolase family protein [Pokkaliibacter plantistimulans]PPC79365.1 acyltransferase [Pokkaliibacter plantistimulans]
MNNIKIAAVQMNSGADVAANLALARHWVTEAAAAGASLVVLPEYFYLMGEQESQRVALAEPWQAGPIQAFLSGLARELGVWLLAGSIPLASDDPERVYNSSTLYDNNGECVGRYDKIHLFGFDNGVESYREADVFKAGQQIATFATPAGRLRSSICYDVRFSELYRHAPGFELLAVPAAFTATTGEAHWEVLLRARAIENQCYVIAAAQTGVHPSGKRTFGHSMIIDPWGKVLALLAEGNGYVMAEIDADYLSKVRLNLPALAHRMVG